MAARARRDHARLPSLMGLRGGMPGRVAIPIRPSISTSKVRSSPPNLSPRALSIVRRHRLGSVAMHTASLRSPLCCRTRRYPGLVCDALEGRVRRHGSLKSLRTDGTIEGWTPGGSAPREVVVTTETEGASTTLGGLQQVCPEPLAHTPAAQHAFRPARAAACHASMRRHAAVELSLIHI